MHLVQILLPVYDNDGRAFGREAFAGVREELTGRFGGVTAHLRSPAEGAWRDPGGGVDRDDVVILEVGLAAVRAQPDPAPAGARPKPQFSRKDQGPAREHGPALSNIHENQIYSRGGSPCW